jgi:hypothetical protein
MRVGFIAADDARVRRNARTRMHARPDAAEF